MRKLWLVDYTVDLHNEDDVDDDVGDDDVDADYDDYDVYALMIFMIKTKTVVTRMILLQSRTHLQKKIFLQEKRCFQLPSADLDSTTLEKCSTQLGAPKCRFVFVFVFVLSCVLKISMIVTFACHHSSSITLWYSVQNLISYDCRQVPVKLPRQVCSRVIQVPKPAPVVHHAVHQPVVHHAVHQPVLTAPHHGLHHGNPSLLKMDLLNPLKIQSIYDIHWKVSQKNMFSSAINYHSISIKIAFVICRILLVLQALVEELEISKCDLI